MLDTVTYIPTILAYAFITLLVVILSFIVIYVGHKVYITIYDNLPVANTMSWSTVHEGPEAPATGPIKTHSANGLEQRGGPFVRKAKTALQFIVSTEECYLAYIVFETGKRPDPQSGSSRRSATAASGPKRDSLSMEATTTTAATTTAAAAAAALPFPAVPYELNLFATGATLGGLPVCQSPTCLIKYYDRLSAIPILKCCPRTPVRSVGTRLTTEYTLGSLLTVLHVHQEQGTPGAASATTTTGTTTTVPARRATRNSA